MATTRKRASKSSQTTTRTRKTAKVSSKAASPPVAGKARTIVYVHGIGNKPAPEVLKCQWDEALFGFSLGERSRLAYWVNRIFYPEPSKATCKMPDTTQDGTPPEVAGLAIRAIADPAEGVEPLLPDQATKKNERESLENIAREALRKEPTPGAAISAAEFQTRVLPLPKTLRQFITRRLTRTLLRDVHEFLFVPERREAMGESLLARLRTGGGPFVVIAHSQGSMVAYSVLSSLPADQFHIDLFVTIGSPLGLQEVQDQLKSITAQPRGLKVPACVKRWVNIADPLDPVCADKHLSGDYAANEAGVRVQDLLRWNLDSPRHPHSGTGYLRLPDLRNEVHGVIDRELFQRIAPFTIARDLVSRMENGDHEERHPVLIELRDQWAPGQLQRSADEVRQEVVGWIRQSLRESGSALTEEDIDLEELSSYVSAQLTRSEVERMTEELRLDSVYRIFRNARKRALLDESINVLQAATAHRGYESRGQGIAWAVLDSGIDALHPHFGYDTPHNNIAHVFDCTSTGKLVEWDEKKKPDAGIDRNGHGTHVCGIIGGAVHDVGISGIAPSVSLYSYKVLGDDGRGSDAKVIKALDHIYDLNRNASSPVIHGVNLSLGGAFDPEVFGCGDTPICKQLRKLWRQGVVVVLAAGNEGYLVLQSPGEEAVGVNADLSIGDPANLEESIAVGSIHKSKPHLYGVSYFSSRGPTADGRCKPDVVAPGERILSCRAGADPKLLDRKNLYVAMSGTSMAAPHVSGIIAAFLSVRREFIGYPDRVKDILLSACTDLKRDRMHQGAGMPNLVKMLLSS